MRRILALLVAMPFAASPALAATHNVRTADELRAAAAASGSEDTVIVLSGTIRTPGGIRFPTTQSSLTIIGEKTSATIEFADAFDGDWSRPQANQNGLESAGGNLTLYGFTIRNFNAGGSAIKYHGPGVLAINRVSFIGCGSVWCPPRNTPVQSASDAFYNQCIGSHGNARSVTVTNCNFIRCATSQRRYSHCIYVSAPYVGVFDCTFDRCGNPFALGVSTFTWTVAVAGNKITNPAASKDNDGVARPAYFASVTAPGQTVYARNVLTGEWQVPWTGHFRPWQFIDCNDYSRAAFAGPWFAANLSTASWVSPDEWRKVLLFDTRSAWPVAVP